MGLLERLKALFGGGKKKDREENLYAALERQVDALESRLVITDRVKRIEGGVEAFDMAFDEVRQLLAGYGGEGGGEEALEVLRRRLELARQAAHLLRETDPEARREMCRRFIADFRQMRQHLHFRTKSKYERIRIDFESGRFH